MRRTASIAAGVIAAVAIGCLPVREPEAEVLRNPSLHILVKDGATIPASATFDIGAKVYKIDTAAEVDLAALDARITAALEAELAAKDYRRVESGEPEILVSFAVAVDASLSASELESAYAEEFPIEFPARGAEGELHYHQGVLLVDFVDRGSKKLLWRGAIRAEIDGDASEATKRRRPREALRILLRHFPRPSEETAASGRLATS